MCVVHNACDGQPYLVGQLPAKLYFLVAQEVSLISKVVWLDSRSPSCAVHYNLEEQACSGSKKAE
jgi:hypothetical protein